MQLEVDVSAEPARLAAATRYLSRYRLWTVQLCGVVIAAGGGWLVLLHRGPRDAVWLLAVGLVAMGVVYVLVGRFLMVPLAVRRAAPSVKQPGHLRLDSRAVTCTGPGVKSVVAWDAILASHEIPGQILLMISKRQGISVPTDRLPPEQLQELRTFLADHGARTAALRPRSGSPAGSGSPRS
jgi:hypothetical protein